MYTHTLINNSEQQITMSTMEGSLSKWTNVVNGWQYRWFVLDDNAGLLSYYTSKEKMMRGARRGCVRLRGAIIGIDDEDDSTFTITTSSYKDDPKTFHFQTRNAEERERWIRALEDTILRHSHTRWDPKKSPPRQDFDRKVAEADAYLQLLIDQIKLIETKQSSVAVEDEEKQQKYAAILTQANAMLNSVKHTIVQLQIAKTGIELGFECVELRVPALPNAVVDRDLPVPQFSYSSSDEDEDYYDAADEISPPSAMQNHISIRRQDSERSQSHVDVLNENRKQPPLPPTKGDGSVDYDALYEEESETEMDSMESHGSVVTHLLSQVKIGMDLTKVALPTFILERRSLLEMYADYFTHPDQFVSIADMPTAKDRMIQVVRWYLCSFHAGRKSGVAKKPYNPILGEIFRCHWDIPNDTVDSSTDTKLVVGGPVPWCKENQLSFIAEQVSHHPPSNFGAHVWTKSKFLGLSIGVHNVGKGWVNVLQHGEEYLLTFPNGYGRSILTIPWIELGGTATIHCAQTGYHATVEFLTKPFYGGKRNRITCQITQPGDKKPFVVINGEWSGAMEAKWADGRSEIFADVKELHTQRKLIKPVCEQEEHESRKVWRDVTVGLRINDMEKATAAKCAIEQKQREEARTRKENNINWQTKLFKETKDGGWIYIKPLTERLHSSFNQSTTT
ncbi:Oxysterol-binding protein-related protein 9 [Melipona quadrifasciata]|uniref:Oxysterol-binding protein-related protein 9 n=1 Tax=Melipona quadrifasciata TaxID=166423 RepID=A0A0N0BD13_9HYME|nr:Oxysterol-binding protein-related protein 9 [Melipona quadrifasciata]